MTEHNSDFTVHRLFIGSATPTVSTITANLMAETLDRRAGSSIIMRRVYLTEDLRWNLYSLRVSTDDHPELKQLFSDRYRQVRSRILSDLGEFMPTNPENALGLLLLGDDEEHGWDATQGVLPDLITDDELLGETALEAWRRMFD